MARRSIFVMTGALLVSFWKKSSMKLDHTGEETKEKLVSTELNRLLTRLSAQRGVFLEATALWLTASRTCCNDCNP